MSSIGSIALSGMQAAQAQLDAAATHVANAQTPAFQRRAAPQGELAEDLVHQLQAKNAFLANLAVFKTSSAMAGALLDTQA